MPRYGMLVKIDRCNGCFNCYLACRDEYASNDYPPYSAAQPAEGKAWMRVTEKERGSVPKVRVDYIATPCLQCGNAPCVDKSEDGAVYRRPDGIVIIDPEKAKGKKEILADCPHRVIQWNAEKDIPQKCTFCAHLLDQGWKQPRCVEACPAGALMFGDLDDPETEISKLVAAMKTEELNADFNLEPNVVYANLPQRFIAGEVVLTDKSGEPASGVTVELSDGTNATKCQTDAFGDFEFDGLKASAKYTLRVTYPGYQTAEKAVTTYADVNVGEIGLEPRG